MHIVMVGQCWRDNLHRIHKRAYYCYSTNSLLNPYPQKVNGICPKEEYHHKEQRRAPILASGPKHQSPTCCSQYTIAIVYYLYLQSQKLDESLLSRYFRTIRCLLPSASCLGVLLFLSNSSINAPYHVNNDDKYH